MIRPLSAAALALVLASPAGTYAALVHGPNLVENGDFKHGSGDAWTYEDVLVQIDRSTAAVSYTPQHLPGGFFASEQLPDGNFGWYEYQDMTWGSIRQTLDTRPGETYQVSYTLYSINNTVVPGFFLAAFDGIAYLPESMLIPTFSPGQFPSIGYVPIPEDFISTMPAQSCPGIDCARFNGGTHAEISFIATATSELTELFLAGISFGAFVVSDVSVRRYSVPEPATYGLSLLGLAMLGAVQLVRRRNPAKALS